ncbi:MAG: NAD-glutamate dehydrogenase [Verrucomicrobia bacterium]|nr:NAD-glutamate dehydrogenase [Verrucomicrobiota bacterium]
MSTPPKMKRLSKEQLQAAIQKESKRFEEYYSWIEKHMPASFFEEVDQDSILLIVYSLMGFNLNDYFSNIHLKNMAFTLSLDSPDADLRVLRHYKSYGIKNYRSFVSNEPPPFPGVKAPLRIARILFSDFVEKTAEDLYPPEQEKEIVDQVKLRNAQATENDVHRLIASLSPLFLKSMTKERLVMALDMYFRAKSRDNCQYEVRYNEDWKGKKDTPSLQIVLAWRNVPKYNFLYHLAEVIHRHGLAMKRVNATYIDPYSHQNILIMSLGLHGMKGGAAWEEANLPDFLKEMVTLKYFEGMQTIESAFIDTGLLTGNQGNLVKTMVYFIHQSLVHADVNMYALDHIEDGLCRHPELTVKLVQAFDAKFNPETANLEDYMKIREDYIRLVDNLDTGNQLNDTRRKNILKQGMNMVDYTLKTNYYRRNKTAFCFRLDPAYLDYLPFDRKDKFPELPYAVFFMKGLYFIGFHIRFRDLSRGGLRTVFPERMEQMLAERNNVFSECYNLAYTQNKKNKDIPEGGAKGVIFLEPYERLLSEEDIYRRELEDAGMNADEIKEKLSAFHKAQKLEYLYQTQRSYIESFLALINCEADGKLRAKNIVDYWKKPEYIYLGPDENMHNAMIEWIASFSKHYDYKPGGAFISSKPGAGINHKEYGVTSLGVNVYMEEVLKYLGIDPARQEFTIKMSGGPDGDVAGNQMENLYRYYRKTAKLLATIDVSGTIFDPKGLDLEIIHQLFLESKPIRFYPPEKLSEGGFLLDTRTKREQTAYAQQTLCWRKIGGKLVEEWLSGNEMNHLLRHNVHQVKADIFIPGGGRPRTLNENNVKDFLDETGKPTAKAIIEGANLYLTPWARRSLEKLGVIIIKDSSANKGGVTCSSFEVLFSLTLSEEEFLKEKPTVVAEILEIIKDRSRDEAQLMLKTHRETQALLTDISEWVSERINMYKDQLSAYLQTVTLSNDPKDPLIRCLLNYSPPLLRNKYQKRVLLEVPDVHKKAIIACHIASRIVYYRGLDWSPSLIDVLPLITQDPLIVGNG